MKPGPKPRNHKMLYLSPQQRQVLTLLAQGKSRDEIAGDIGRPLHNVDAIVGQIRAKAEAIVLSEVYEPAPRVAQEVQADA